ncbi:anthranilate phosphoribosyltransferase [Alicyclobacillus cellulosilyticus]|uniref:Anthranilate phosphoribosyltransferase n=1 Tax=Alicyclobacillus cellulosilyticus TaxID=1003997 RepID=A0A917KD42_9BACL|nr:anthranilate phosphoribosyltransferase [Alicyclobacillus cellulosilyticus]GGJ07524.1 anthranilate phosphoribosyltransferase [Alicyclobacillus cellulosilyticus]
MSMAMMDALKKVVSGSALDAAEAEACMDQLMSGSASPIQIASLVTAMAVRGETVEEMVGFARAMRRHALQVENVPDGAVDTCGTGGDGANTFNISTAAAIVAAAGGVPVAKHGNRAASSRCGSADVLAALGARIDGNPETARRCLQQTRLCFLFAQSFHPAMRHAAEVRRQLGFRTIFNFLGPLTNPARVRRQVLGVPRLDLVRKMAEALKLLGCEHALVVHGAGGIDEISIVGETAVAEVKDGRICEYTIAPEDVGLARADLAAIQGGDAEENARIIQEVLSGARGPKRDVVVLNAGAVLYVGGKATRLYDGVRLAEVLIDSGAARETLTAFVRATQMESAAEVQG